MSKDRQIFIEQVANNVRCTCQITDYGFNNIFEAAEKLEYRVVRYPIGKDALLGFAMIKNTDRIIFTNSSQILSREIFSMAHEIGHQKLHLSEQGKLIIRDDNFDNTKDETENEAHYFARCLLMPKEKVEQFIRLELNDKELETWGGIEIARMQKAFNVSYDMVLVRLKSLGLLKEAIFDNLKLEKKEKTVTELLKPIGKPELIKPSNVKQIPAEYLEWVISNYREKLIPKSSLELGFKVL